MFESLRIILVNFSVGGRRGRGLVSFGGNGLIQFALHDFILQLLCQKKRNIIKTAVGAAVEQDCGGPLKFESDVVENCETEEVMIGIRGGVIVIVREKRFFRDSL